MISINTCIFSLLILRLEHQFKKAVYIFWGEDVISLGKNSFADSFSKFRLVVRTGDMAHRRQLRRIEMKDYNHLKDEELDLISGGPTGGILKLITSDGKQDEPLDPTSTTSK